MAGKIRLNSKALICLKSPPYFFQKLLFVSKVALFVLKVLDAILLKCFLFCSNVPYFAQTFLISLERRCGHFFQTLEARCHWRACLLPFGFRSAYLPLI